MKDKEAYDLNQRLEGLKNYHKALCDRLCAEFGSVTKARSAKRKGNRHAENLLEAKRTAKNDILEVKNMLKRLL